MENTCNSSNIEDSFKKSLLAGKDGSITYSDDLQRNSVRNYLSDLRSFIAWAEAKAGLKSFTSETVSAVSVSQVLGYRQYLIDENVPYATINRRLSSLRKFFSFCIDQGWIQHNPAKEVENIKEGQEKLFKTDIASLIENYQMELQKKGNGKDIDFIKEFLITN